ncbi:MAG: VOC family protein [Cyclobacteriaceae bacterium]
MGSTSSSKPTKQLKDYVNWFEIPALNIQRAVSFYNHIYGLEMEITEANNYAMAFFPADKGIGGAIVMGEGSIPSEVGPLVYLNGGKDLSLVLNNIEAAGGRVVLPKTLIDEDSGYFALFIDSEGNRLALHSQA